MGSVGKIVSGIAGGAKRQATQVAHNAISNVARGSQRALRTGDWRGEAGRAYNSSRREAVGRAQQQYTQGRNQMRERVSHHIHDYQRRFDDRMQRHYSQWRQHPRFEQPRYRQQYGPPPPRQWRGYYGAGFGKAHFKKIEKAAHKHIDKVFAAAHKHTKAQINALKTGTKKGAAKKAAAAAINAAHKQHGGALKEVIKAVKADVAKKSKKGGGRAVGAGRKIGAGAKGSGILGSLKGLQAKAIRQATKGKYGNAREMALGQAKDIAKLYKKKGAVGAAGKSKKKKKRGGAHLMSKATREASLRGVY